MPGRLAHGGLRRSRLPVSGWLRQRCLAGPFSFQSPDMTLAAVKLSTRPDQHSEEAASVLAQHLERAKAGEVVSVALVTLNRDGSTSSHWSSSDDFQPLIGGVSILAHRMIANHCG